MSDIDTPERDFAIDFAVVLTAPLLDTSAAPTVGEFMKLMLLDLMTEPESFNGYRPFGNSDWQDMLVESLREADVISEDYDFYDGLRIIKNAIAQSNLSVS